MNWRPRSMAEAYKTGGLVKKTKMDWDCSRDVCQKTLGTYPTKKGTICIRKLIILNLVVFDCGEKKIFHLFAKLLICQ